MLLEKARLSAPHPDYHTLLATLMQVLDGLIMDAWRRTSGFPSLGEFARSKPTPEQLLKLGSIIVDNFASPWTNGPAGQSTDDCIHQNTRLLLRDLLYVAALVRAISDSDFG